MKKLTKLLLFIIFLIVPFFCVKADITVKQNYTDGSFNISSGEYLYYDITFDANATDGPFKFTLPENTSIIDVTELSNMNGSYTSDDRNFSYTHSFSYIKDTSTQCTALKALCTNPTYEAKLRAQCNETCEFHDVSTHEIVSFRVKVSISPKYSDSTLKIISSIKAADNSMIESVTEANVTTNFVPNIFSLLQSKDGINFQSSPIYVGVDDYIYYKVLYDADIANDKLYLSLPVGVSYVSHTGGTNFNGTLSTSSSELVYEHNFINLVNSIENSQCAQVGGLCSYSLYAQKLHDMCPFTCGYKTTDMFNNHELVEFIVKAKVNEDKDDYTAYLKEYIADGSTKDASELALPNPWRVESTGIKYGTLKEAYDAASDDDTLTLLVPNYISGTQAVFDSGKKITINSLDGTSTITRGQDNSIININNSLDEITLGNIIIGDTSYEDSSFASSALLVNNGVLNVSDNAIIRNVYTGILIKNSGVVNNYGTITGIEQYGVSISSGTFNMLDGTITASTGSYGSGISCMTSTCNLGLYGGIITNNTSSLNFGAILSLSNIHVGNNIIVNNNNTASSLPNNLVYPKTSTIYIDEELNDSAKIHVTLYNNYVPNAVVAKGTDIGEKSAHEIALESIDNFVLDQTGNLVMSVKGNDIILVKPLWKVASTGLLYATLEDAYSEASTNDEIILMDQTYSENLTDGYAICDNINFNLGKKIVISSESGAGKIARTDSLQYMFYIEAFDDITIKNFTIGKNTIEDTSLSKNSYIFNMNGKLKVDSCTIKNINGEAITARGNSTTIIDNSTITNVESDISPITTGSGSGTLLINNSSITNSKGNYTGAVFNMNSDYKIMIYDSTIKNNESIYYGAVFSTNSVHLKGQVIATDNLSSSKNNDITLYKDYPIILDGALASSSSVGVYKAQEAEHASLKIVAAGLKEDVAASYNYFFDNYTNDYLIEISDTDDTKIVFAPNRITAHDIYVNANVANTIDSSSVINLSNAVCKTSSGGSSTVFLDSSDLASINNAVVTDTKETITNVTFSCLDAIKNINVIIVPNAAITSSNNTSYINSSNKTITSQTAKDIESITNLNSIHSSLGELNGESVTPSVSSTAYNTNIKNGVIGSYNVSFSVGEGSSLATKTSLLTIVKDGSVVGNDVSIFANNYITIPTKKAEYQTDDQIKSLMQLSGTISSGNNAASTNYVISGITAQLKNGTPGTYPITYKVVDPITNDNAIITKNFVVLRNPEAYGENVIITESTAKAISKTGILSTLKDLVNASGQSNDALVSRNDIVATISNDDIDALTSGTLGQYNLKLEVGVGLGDVYYASSDVKITVVKDGSIIPETNNAIYANNATYKKMYAASLNSNDKIKQALGATAVSGADTNPVIDIEILDGSIADITSGAIRSYQVKFTVDKGTVYENSIIRVLTIVDNDAINVTENDELYTIIANDAVISSEMATLISNKEMLKGIHSLYATYENKLGESNNTTSDTIVNLSNFEDISSGKKGVYTINFVNGKAFIDVNLTVYNHLVNNILINEVLGANNFMVKLSQIPNYSEIATYISLADAKAVNKDDNSEVTITDIVVNNNNLITETGSYNVAFKTANNTIAIVKMLVLDDSIITNGSYYIEASDASIDDVAAKNLTKNNLVNLMNATGMDDLDVVIPNVFVSDVDFNNIKNGIPGEYEIKFSVGSGANAVSKTVKLTVNKTIKDITDNPYTGDRIIKYVTMFIIFIFIMIGSLKLVNKKIYIKS